MFTSLIKLNPNNLFQNIFNAQKQTQTCRVHDYRPYTEDVDYFKEFTDNGDQAYLTSQGDIKVGDLVVFSESDRLCKYRVQDIDYYNDRLSTFMALLVKFEG